MKIDWNFSVIKIDWIVDIKKIVYRRFGALNLIESNTI